jgi:hypothetical protein
MTDMLLCLLNGEFDIFYSASGRPSSAPEYGIAGAAVADVLLDPFGALQTISNMQRKPASTLAQETIQADLSKSLSPILGILSPET